MGNEYIISITALVLSFASFMVAFFEVRRCNKAIVKIVDCKSSWSQDTMGTWGHLSVTILNKGISLENISVALEFAEEARKGSVQIVFSDKNTSKKSLQRGMKIECKECVNLLDSKDILPMMRNMVEDFSSRKAFFVVYSNDFEVSRFKIGGLVDKIKIKINSKISTLQMKKSKSYMKDGRQYISNTYFPKFRCCLYNKVEGYIQTLNDKGFKEKVTRQVEKSDKKLEDSKEVST